MPLRHMPPRATRHAQTARNTISHGFPDYLLLWRYPLFFRRLLRVSTGTLIVSMQRSNGSAAAAASRRPGGTPVLSTVSAIKKPSFGNCRDRTADPDLSGLRMHFDRTRPAHFDSGSDGDIGIGYPKAAGEQANRACRGTRCLISVKV